MSEKADDDGGLSPTEEENAFWQNLDRRGLKVLIKKQYKTMKHHHRAGACSRPTIGVVKF